MLEDLYKAVILEHYKKPHNRGELEHPTIRQDGHNPSCGDELTLDVQISDGIITDVRFFGQGCAISQASASMLTTAIKGKSIPEALTLAEEFSHMIKTGETSATLGDLVVLQGIHKLHARVKCATLAWQTLQVALSPVGT